MPHLPSTIRPETFTSFGALLLYLRRRARLRQRDLAAAVGYGEAQIGRLENDQRLPDVATVLAQFIPALGLEDEPELAARLVELARAARQPLDSPGEAPPPPPPSDPAPIPDDLMPPVTPLIGREDELETLGRLLADPASRCITLVGPGGVGKTRLALAALQRYGAQFADGAYSVSLADLDAVGLVAPAICRALGLSAAGDAQALLTAHLRDRHTLLLLDNLEHLIEAADQLAALLAAAPRLRLLVTSRERLSIRSEAIVEVVGLRVPDGADADPARLADSEALRLFLLTARRNVPDFAPTPDDLATIGAICRAVEGHPLAIELAAAWAHLLSPAEIAQELQRALAGLSTKLRDVPARHRSLEAVFAHSWDLLSPDEQRALRQLAVFRGSFGREAAAVVLASAEPGGRPVGPAVLATLGALVDKSMLRRAGAPGEGRYALHELVRQYAAERQRDRPDEAAQAAAAHGRHYLGLLAAAQAALRGPDQARTAAGLGAELENLWAAVLWGAGHGEFRLLRAAWPALRDLLEWRYLLHDGLALFQATDAALADLAVGAEPPELRAVRALALSGAGWLSYYAGKPEPAQGLLEAAAALAEGLDDPLVAGVVALDRGSMAGRQGDVAQGRRLLRRALRACSAAGDEWYVARTLYALAQLAQQDGDYVIAQALLADAIGRLRALGGPQAVSLLLSRLGFVEARLGRYAQAERALQESLMLASAAHDRRVTAVVLLHMGGMAQQRGAHREARYFFRESAQLFGVLGERYSAIDAFAQAAYSAVEDGDHPAARLAIAEAWRLAADLDAGAVTLGLLVSRAALALAEGQAEQAVEALALARNHPASSQDVRDRAAHLLGRAEPVLTPFAFVSAQARGRAGTVAAYLSERTP